MKETCKLAWKNKILDQSARLAFYFLLSLFPFLIFLLIVAGLTVDAGEEVKIVLQNSLSGIIPPAAIKLIENILDDVTKGASTQRLSLALIFTLWSASRGMKALIEGLNVSYGVEESRPWWKRSLMALGLTCGLILLNAATFLMVIYSGVLVDLISGLPVLKSFNPVIWEGVQWGILLVFVLGVFYLVYRYAPNFTNPSRKHILAGTITGVVLWLATSFGFQLYLSFFDRFNKTYGSLSAVIILLLWLYFSSASILAGGTLNSVISRCRGMKET